MTTLPPNYLRLSSKWLETNVAPEDVIFHYPYADLWGPSRYQGKFIPSYDRSQFTYATARTDLPREAYADSEPGERAEDHCGVSSVEVPAKVLHTEKVRMKIGPEGVESVETDSERTIATLRAQLDAKDGECQRLKDDLSTAIDDGNRSRQIIYAMAEALKPETGEHNIDCAKRVATERDKLRAEVEHRTKQRDEFQNLFIEASDGFNQRGEQLARLNAELDAAQARCGELERAAQDERRMDWIIDNCTISGGGNGFELRVFIPVDSECIRDAIDRIICADNADHERRPDSVSPIPVVKESSSATLTPSQQPDNLDSSTEGRAERVANRRGVTKFNNHPPHERTKMKENENPPFSTKALLMPENDKVELLKKAGWKPSGHWDNWFHPITGWNYSLTGAVESQLKEDFAARKEQP